MNKIPISTLGRIAAGVTLGGCGTLYATRWAIQGKICESVSYKEALECFRNNRNAVDFLGEPIKEKRVDIGNNDHYGRKDNVMWVAVPLTGQKHSAHLYYWVTTNDRNENKFRVSRIELEIHGTKENRKILLKDDPSNESKETIRDSNDADNKTVEIEKTSNR